jgi:hypothetical protein
MVGRAYGRNGRPQLSHGAVLNRNDTNGAARRARLDSRLEAQGAEFLVLGALLTEGILANKSYLNTPGYDLIATNPDRGTSCTIQVKSRWATDYDGGFLIKNKTADFVVFIELNRGYRYSKPKKGETGKEPPRFFVFPMDALRNVPTTKGWGKLLLKYVKPSAEHYLEKWELIGLHLVNKAAGF